MGAATVDATHLTFRNCMAKTMNLFIDFVLFTLIRSIGNSQKLFIQKFCLNKD